MAWATLDAADLLLALAGAAAGLLSAGWLAAVEWGAWTLAAPGRKLDPAGPPADPPGWQAAEAVADDGARLSAAWRPEPGSDRVLVILHGFAEDRAAMLGRAAAVEGRGWSVLVPDARGYGRSGGAVVTFGGREAADLRAWLDLLAPAGARVAVWGRSMGAAVAVRTAAEDPRVVVLVLESPNPSLEVALRAWLARARLPGLLARPILRRAGRVAGLRGPMGRPSPLDLAPRVGVPALVVHGSADSLIRPDEARRLASALAAPAEYVEVPEARHADVFEVGGPALLGRVGAFLERAVPPGPG